MSQHIFSATSATNRPLRVMAGWDPPLQRYFLDVELSDAGDEEDEYLFTSMREAEYLRRSMRLQDIQMHLDAFQITPPTGYIAELQSEEGSPRDGLNGSKRKIWS